MCVPARVHAHACAAMSGVVVRELVFHSSSGEIVLPRVCEFSDLNVEEQMTFSLRL